MCLTKGIILPPNANQRLRQTGATRVTTVLAPGMFVTGDLLRTASSAVRVNGVTGEFPAHVFVDYLPLVQPFMPADMGPGANFSNFRFMAPEMVNALAPWTRCSAIYEYDFGDFQRRVCDGSAKLLTHSVPGTTRGAHDLAMQQPCRLSRITG